MPQLFQPYADTVAHAVAISVLVLLFVAIAGALFVSSATVIAVPAAARVSPADYQNAGVAPSADASLPLAVSVTYLPLGAANTVIAMTIAVLKGAVAAAFFMELRERNPLTLTFAGAGFFWLGIMLWLALADYLTRPNFPPAMAWGS